MDTRNPRTASKVGAATARSVDYKGDNIVSNFGYGFAVYYTNPTLKKQRAAFRKQEEDALKQYLLSK